MRSKLLFWVFTVVVTFLIGYMAIKYISSDLGYIDFPCFTTIDDGVLSSQNFSPDSVNDFEFFITFLPVHYQGGTCDRFALNNGEPVKYLQYTITNDRKNIIIDHRKIKPGEAFSDSSTFYSFCDFWFVYEEKLEFENRGFVESYLDSELGAIVKLERGCVVIIGRYSVHAKPYIFTVLIFVALILILLINILLFVRRKQKGVKEKQ